MEGIKAIYREANACVKVQDLNASRRNATERLTSDLSIIPDWGRVQCLKIQFLHLSTT